MTRESEAGLPGLRTPASAVLALLPLVGVPAILLAGRAWVFAAVMGIYLATAALFWEDSRRRGLDDYSAFGFALLGVAALPLYWWRHLRPHPGSEP